MSATDALAWQLVARFLRGELDHADDATRADIARACAWLDEAARMVVSDVEVSAPQDWDEHLCHVVTEER